MTDNCDKVDITEGVELAPANRSVKEETCDEVRTNVVDDRQVRVGELLDLVGQRAVTHVANVVDGLMDSEKQMPGIHIAGRGSWSGARRKLT